ncbi:MAG: anti-sigma factor family protein [bacterium]
MKCENIQNLFMSYLTEDASEEEKLAFEAHVADCSSCASELKELRVVWSSLETWEDQSLPNHLVEKILSRAREAVVTVQENVWANSWASFKRLLKPMAPIAMGLVAAVLSAGILSSKMNLSTIHPLGLTAVGALWTAIYSIIFYLLFFTGKGKANSWRDFAQASITAVGIFLVFTLISPVPSSIHFCRYYAVTQPVIERLSIGGSFFLFGALYAMIPMSISAYFSGSRSGTHPLAKGSLAGVMFVALLAPSIYLQCAPFALGVLLVWFGGALLGSVLGGVIGYWVRYRFAAN